MSRKRAAAYLVGGILLAAWLASAAGVSMRPPVTPPPPRQSQDAIELDSVAADVQSQALRLRERLATAPAVRPSVRNPFAFAEVAEVRPKPAPQPTAPLPAFVQQMISEPNLVLLGVAEEGSVRTAMISLGDELLMASEGQPVTSRYRVLKVGPDSVELTDLATGATRRLLLRSPVSLP